MSEHKTILDFFHKIWREEEAIVCLAFKNPSTGVFSRDYFEWPSEEIPVVQKVMAERISQEVYFSPALYRERSSKKEAVLGSFCFWVEFDGSMPVEFEGLPKPNLVVQSSTETHQHIYWTSDTLIPVERLEAVNRSLTYKLNADASGWDCNQVLRPPETLNHKKGLRTKLVTSSDHYVNSVAFSENLPKNVPPQLEIQSTLPHVKEVIYKYQTTLPQRVFDLITKGVQRDRSAGLMNLGYSLAEMNMTNVEILTVLLYADNTWGKFAKRSDQLQRLTEIVTRARQKYPFKTNEDSELVTLTNSALLALEIDVEWLWEGMLYQSGLLLLTGPPGVGKSTFSLDMADHLILGHKFLNREVSTNKKVLFVSLEMEDIELKVFRTIQMKSRNPDQVQKLDEKFHYIAKGSPIYYNREEERTKFERLIVKENYDVIIFDSLSAMTEQELSKETESKLLMDWAAHLRTEYGIAIIIIHHNRKAQVGNKNPNELSDVYGSQIFTARPTTVLTLTEERKRGLIRVACLKLRLAPRPQPFYIRRKDDLTFHLEDGKIIIEDEEEDEVDVTESAQSFITTETTGFEF